jgi:hypothetical protein
VFRLAQPEVTTQKFTATSSHVHGCTAKGGLQVLQPQKWFSWLCNHSKWRFRSPKSLPQVCAGWHNESVQSGLEVMGRPLSGPHMRAPVGFSQCHRKNWGCGLHSNMKGRGHCGNLCAVGGSTLILHSMNIHSARSTTALTWDSRAMSQ